MSRITLGGGGEFDLIRRLLGPDWVPPPGVVVGPGDDCAVLDDGLVVSTDLAVEGIHFRYEWVTPEEAGFRAAAGALSDLAAVASRPVGVFLSMALPESDASAVAVAFQAGVGAACHREEVSVLGGDLARSPGPAVLNVTVLGKTLKPVLRNGVRPGHEVWVTGRLGGSAAAVALWEAGRTPGEDLRTAFASPRPRIREARWLADRVPMGGLIDLSDGLTGDAGHLAAASGVGIVLDADSIPLHEGLAEAGDAVQDPLGFALGGGEDFELCFSVPPGSLDDWRDPFQDTFDLPLTRVGSAVEGEGVVVGGGKEDGSARLPRGFSHFEGEEAE